MSEEKTLILSARQVDQKIRRIAFEILEHNFKEEQIVIAGIDGQGYDLATRIVNVLKAIATMKVSLVRVTVNKEKPQASDVILDCDPADLRKATIVLVDDVLNTGRTTTYGMKPLLDVDARKIEVAVLVNRSHTLFPIAPQYTGYELPTTLNEHVEVHLGAETAVYLR